MNDEFENKEAVEKALKTLPEQAQKVVYLRIYLDMTYKECAGELGLSPERIRQIYVKAVRQLQHPTRVKILKGLDGYNPDRYSQLHGNMNRRLKNEAK